MNSTTYKEPLPNAYLRKKTNATETATNKYLSKLSTQTTMTASSFVNNASLRRHVKKGHNTTVNNAPSMHSLQGSKSLCDPEKMDQN